jgi:predicted HTH domain antitoxin
MAVNQQTLLKIQSLEQLYRNGYHSNSVDAAIDKLVGLEQTRVEQELARLEETLHKLEAQYHLSSAEFYRLFRAGEMGDEADFFEWSALYQMWLSTREQLDILKLLVAIYRYQTEDISLAKAANLAGISFDRMKAVMLQRGVQLRLGPVDDAEIQEEVATLERLFAERNQPA